MKTLLGIHPTTSVQDVGLLLARLCLGAVMIAHGWQKLDGQGFTATADGFGAMGIPLPEAAAAYAIVVELVGGALLIAGLLTPVVSVLVAADMAGAYWYVHRDGGFFAADGGYEFVMVLALFALTLAAFGAGRLSFDRFLFGGRAAPAAGDTVVVDDREVLSRR